MKPRIPLARIALLALGAGSVAVSALSAQSIRSSGKLTARTASGPPLPERAIRRDIPLTGMIRRAFAAGTRDSTGAPGKNYWLVWPDYTISARFDPATAMVSGHETIVLHNNSPNPMNAIQMRLDQNLFAANVPRAEVVSEITDGMKVTKLVVNGQTVDLNPPAGRGGRGGGGFGGRGGRGGADSVGPRIPTVNGLNLTSARITPAAPIPAGGTVTIDADWNFKVPKSDNGRGVRMGSWGDSLFQVAQWYPRVAVFDDLRQGGWDTDPYLGPSEFYNNLGHFDVKLDLPSGWLVGSSGILQNPQEVLTADERQRLSHVLDSDSQQVIVGAGNLGPGKSTAAGDRLVWHYVADSVADVAWATSRSFVWDATRAAIPGKGTIPINILYLPGHTQYANAGATVRHALQFYSRLWMPYTFPVETVVDGPENGMEYPMFIMSSTGASDHETGHQWWPMMVNTNETWYGFMDEGFNQYMNILSGADRGGRGGGGGGRGGAARTGVAAMNPPGGTALLNGQGQRFGSLSGNEQVAPLMWDANYGGPQYSEQAYGRAPLMLSMLGGVVGDSAVWHAMSDYAKAWKFKHPSPWDYAFFMSNALHRDLGWFWYYWLFTTESVDGSIASVSTAGTRTTVTVRQDGQMPSPVVLAIELAPRGPAIRLLPNSVKLDSATVLVTYPVDVWFNGSRTFKASLDFGRKIEKITLDPFGRFPDRDPSDNAWPRDTTATRGQGGRGGRGGGQ
jgi:hypothetical protein